MSDWAFPAAVMMAPDPAEPSALRLRAQHAADLLTLADPTLLAIPAPRWSPME
jgi:hypothetical protein